LLTTLIRAWSGLRQRVAVAGELRRMRPDGLWRLERFGRPGHEEAQGYPKRSRDQSEIQNRDIPLAAFDGADESAMQTARVPQFGLRELSPFAQIADPPTQFFQKLSFFDVHA